LQSAAKNRWALESVPAFHDSPTSCGNFLIRRVFAPRPHEAAAIEDDRHREADDRDNEKPAPGIDALARTGAFEANARARGQPFERGAHRLHQLDLDGAVAALRHRQDRDAVRPEQDLVAGVEPRVVDAVAIDDQRRGAELFDRDPALARHQRGDVQPDADVGQRHLVVGATAKPDARPARTLRPAHHGGSAPGENGDLNLHTLRRDRCASGPGVTGRKPR
jgi:hypothetical protein